MNTQFAFCAGAAEQQGFAIEGVSTFGFHVIQLF
jgi:hypothetical protein